MTYRGFRHVPPRACLAVLLLALVAGCGSSSDATSKYGAPPPADRAVPDASPSVDDSPGADSAPDDAGGKSADRPASTGSAAIGVKLSGRVVFDGPPPERRVINMTKDAKCIVLHGGKPVLDEDLLVSDEGGVKNVFVYVRRGAPKIEYPMPAEPAVLDQKDCMYRPRVQGLRVGQRLLVGNDDPVTHNVRSFPLRNRPFNFGQPPDTEPRERIFAAAERAIEVQCDIHPWMHAYLFVMDHPFFSVTDQSGAYTIEGLPPGEYTLAIWHEKPDNQQLARQQQTVAVGDSDLDEVNFTYPP